MKKRDNLLSVLGSIIRYFLLWVGGFLIGHLVSLMILRESSLLHQDFKIGLSRIIVSSIQIAVFILYVKYIEKDTLESLKLKCKKPIRTYIMGIMIGFMVITIIAYVLKKLQCVSFVQSIEKVSIFYVMLVLGWLIQSASEEIAIRGWLIPHISQKSSQIVAIIITSLIFGICHLFSSGTTVLSFFNIILSGIFFSLYSLYTKNIIGVWGIHFAWNWSLGNIYGFPVSGFNKNGSTVLIAVSNGSTFLTGGAFGIEASLITTVILILGIIIIGYLKLKRI